MGANQLDSPEFVTARQAVELFPGIFTERHLSRLRQRGEVDSAVVRRRLVFRTSSLRDYVERQIIPARGDF